MLTWANAAKKLKEKAGTEEGEVTRTREGEGGRKFSGGGTSAYGALVSIF